MRYKLIFLSLLIVLGVATWALVSDFILSDISENIVRLHIIANSDSEKDQSIKYAVRDRILSKVKSKSGDYKYFAENLDEAVLTANEVLAENGVDYESKAVVGNFYFPTKQYENITLPAGEYNAVRIVLGEGKGQNWWCVMYPPLCFTNDTCGKLDDAEFLKLKEAMSKESFDIINSGDEKITVKPVFKLVELWQKIKNKI